jgi:hypothetical protein
MHRKPVTNFFMHRKPITAFWHPVKDITRSFLDKNHQMSNKNSRFYFTAEILQTRFSLYSSPYQKLPNFKTQVLLLHDSEANFYCLRGEDNAVLPAWFDAIIRLFWRKLGVTSAPSPLGLIAKLVGEWLIWVLNEPPHRAELIFCPTLIGFASRSLWVALFLHVQLSRPGACSFVYCRQDRHKSGLPPQLAFLFWQLGHRVVVFGYGSRILCFLIPFAHVPNVFWLLELSPAGQAVRLGSIPRKFSKSYAEFGLQLGAVARSLHARCFVT